MPEGVVGSASFGELGVYIIAGILNAMPATNGSYAGTGKTKQSEATLERTGSHELGHTGKLRHPINGTMPSNLLNQTSQPDAGIKVTNEQILQMKEAHDKGELNKGRQCYD
ncbi:hypothetical protein [Pseudomonas shirazensis]